MMRRFMTALMVGMMVLGVVTAPAAAYDWPSTNEINMANDGPYVHVIDSGPGWIELEFVDTDLTAKFELRPDGHISPRDLNPDGSCKNPHGIAELAAEGECRHTGFEVEQADGTETAIFAWNDGWLEPHHTIEVRKSGGAERDTDFNWVTFVIPPIELHSKADCRDGGWDAHGFKNQGQCMRFVNTGKDNRP